VTRKLRAKTIGIPLTAVATALTLAVLATPVSASSTSLSVQKPPSSATISETGSTLLYPLFNLWVAGYNQTYPGVTVNTAGTGSGTGITDATNGTVEIGASDAYLSTADLKAAPTLENIPLAVSAQLIGYNLPTVTAHLKLSGKVLAEIYEGKITTWNSSAIVKLNPGVTLPNMPIVTLHRSDGSGDTFLFTSYLTKTTTKWATSVGYDTTVTWPAAPGALAEQGNGGMVAGCKATPGCIAYIGISYQSEMLGDGLNYAQVQNKKGKFVVPNKSTIGSGAAQFANHTPANGTVSMIYGTAPNGYPIINYEYAIVNKKQSSNTTAKAVRSVLQWTINPKDGNSPTYLTQVDFQALPTKVATNSYKQIAKIK
jgi:phosphate transport system substrate-binding protein